MEDATRRLNKTLLALMLTCLFQAYQNNLFLQAYQLLRPCIMASLIMESTFTWHSQYKILRHHDVITHMRSVTGHLYSSSWIPCKLVIPSRDSVTLISWKNSFSDISRKCILWTPRFLSWSFQVLNTVLYLWQPEAPKKGALKYFFS